MNNAFKISPQGGASDGRVHGLSLYPGGYGADADTALLLKFDEGAGSVAIDYSDQKNDGEIVGGKWKEGKYGYGLELDGINDRIVIPHDPTLNLTNTFCIEAWVKAEYYDKQMIVEKPGSYYLELFKYDKKKIKFRGGIYIGGVEKKISTEWKYKIRKWIHVAFQMSEDGHLSLVVNGVEEKVSDFTCGVPDANANDIFIGHGSDGYYFQGRIDEIRISNIYRPVPNLDPNI